MYVLPYIQSKLALRFLLKICTMAMKVIFSIMSKFKNLTYCTACTTIMIGFMLSMQHLYCAENYPSVIDTGLV